MWFAEFSARMGIPLAAGPRRIVISTSSWRQCVRRMSDGPGVTQSPSSAHHREHPFWLPHSVAQGAHRPLVPAIDGKWMTDDQLVGKWVEALRRGKPRVISNFSGFLEEQHWFQHSESDPHGGTFTTQVPHQDQRTVPQRPSFAALRDSILAQALGSGGNDEALRSDQGFDKIVVKLSMGRCNFDPSHLEGNAQPPLERFQKWIQKSDPYRNYQFGNTIDALLEASKQNGYLCKRHPVFFITAARIPPVVLLSFLVSGVLTRGYLENNIPGHLFWGTADPRRWQGNHLKRPWPSSEPCFSTTKRRGAKRKCRSRGFLVSWCLGNK